MEKIRQLKIGESYTLAGFTLGGKPYFQRFRLVKLTYRPSEYADSYMLTTAIGMTNARRLIKLEPEKQFVIWQGYHTPDISLVYDRKIKDFDGGAVAVGIAWKVFDPRYMIRAKASVKREPVCENIKEVKHDHGALFNSNVIS